MMCDEGREHKLEARSLRPEDLRRHVVAGRWAQDSGRGRPGQRAEQGASGMRSGRVRVGSLHSMVATQLCFVEGYMDAAMYWTGILRWPPP